MIDFMTIMFGGATILDWVIVLLLMNISIGVKEIVDRIPRRFKD